LGRHRIALPERLHDKSPYRPLTAAADARAASSSYAAYRKHTAWAYTHGPASADWPGLTDRHVEAMEAQIERFAPGFRDRILARHTLAPAELQARDANLVDGDVGGGSYLLRQAVFRLRPILSPSPYRTPLSGLFLGSAAAFPGGAVHGVPGDAAARAALSHARRRGGGIHVESGLLSAAGGAGLPRWYPWA
jgi:phytoene dehydrogenase-like protein